MHQAPIEVVAQGPNQVGEGPVWLVDQGMLVWVDITRHLVQWFDPGTGAVEVLDVGKSVGAVVPTRSGNLVAALAGEFALIVPTARTVRTLAFVEHDLPTNRMNDGKCDSHGRFWAGTMALDLSPGAGSLYRLNTDCSVETVLSPVTLSNGIDWSPDDQKMYYVDSLTQQIDLFDFDAISGGLSNRRPFVQIPPDDGMPDGITVDSEGCVWVALWGGGSVRRYTPRGSLDMVIEIPAKQTTSCAFGGPDLTDLYVTSAAFDLSPAELEAQPNAGALFRCRPGVRGRAPNTCRTQSRARPAESSS